MASFGGGGMYGARCACSPGSTKRARAAKLAAVVVEDSTSMDSSLPPPATSEAASFTMPFAVPQEDIDVLGHASNIAYVRWVQDVAVGHSDAVGLTWDAYRELGAV